MKTLSKYSKNILLITSTSIIISGCSFLPKEEEVLAPPLAEPAEIEYNTAEVKVGDIVNKVQGVGSLVSDEMADLYYEETGGRISKVAVKQGEEVEKGQVLVELETGNIAHQIQLVEIELQKAKLRLAQLKEQEASKYDIQQTELDVKSVQLRLSQMRQQLSDARLVAPFSGYVTFVAEKNTGDVVNAYEPIIQIADPNDLNVVYTANSANDLLKVTVGMEANVNVAGEEVKGEVVQTPSTVPEEVKDQEDELYKRSLIITLEKIPETAGVGINAQIEVATETKQDVLVIPKGALRSSFDREYVQVLEDGTKREVDIEKGVVSATEVEVIKGLEAGDQVILK